MNTREKMNRLIKTTPTSTLLTSALALDVEFDRATTDDKRAVRVAQLAIFDELEVRHPGVTDVIDTLMDDPATEDMTYAELLAAAVRSL